MLVLKIAAPVEATVNVQEGSDLEAVIADDKDLIDDQSTINSNPFIVLMAQIMSNPPTENKHDIPVKEKEYEASDSVLSPQELNTSAMPAVYPETVHQPDSLEHNVAVAWIDSDTFQAAQSKDVFQVNNEMNSQGMVIKEDKPMGEPAEFELMDQEEWVEESVEWIRPFPLDKKGNQFVNEIKNNPQVQLNEKSNDSSVPFQENLFPEDKSEHYGALPIETPPLDRPRELESLSDNLMGLNAHNIPQIYTAELENNASHSSETHFLEIPCEIANPKWVDYFSEHIVWLGEQDIKSAQIKIHPEDLGPLEINIKVIKDDVSVSINSYSNQVRDIVDQGIPRLRDMMSQQGINLSEVNINAGSDSHQSSQQDNQWKQETFHGNSEEIQLTPLSRKIQKGLIDYFA